MHHDMRPTRDEILALLATRYSNRHTLLPIAEKARQRALENPRSQFCQDMWKSASQAVWDNEKHIATLTATLIELDALN